MNLLPPIPTALAVTSLLCAPAFAAEKSIDGRVLCDDKPLAGALVQATVFTCSTKDVDTFRRQDPWNRSVLSARSGPDGRFHIAAPPDAVTADCVIAAPGVSSSRMHWPSTPDQPKPDIKLRRISSFDSKSPSIRGRIITADGHPVVGAIVIRIGTEFPGGRSAGGSLEDAVSITDNDGRFTQVWPIGAKPPDAAHTAIAARFRVSAPDLACTTTDVLDAVAQEHTITLTPGATITGRIERPKSTPGALRVVAQLSNDQASDSQRALFEAAVDDTGSFNIPHVPTGVELRLYALTYDHRITGASDSRQVPKLDPGQSFDAGPVILADGVTVSGKLLQDETGEPMKSEHRVHLSQPGTLFHWDSPVAPDGSFTFEHIPIGPEYTLGCFDPNFIVAPSNPNYRQGPNHELRGNITRPRSDLVVRMCKKPEAVKPPPPLDSLPLRGVEPAR